MPRVYPYTCRFCGETFKTRSALNLHKIAEHILESRPNQTANTGEGGVTWSKLTAASADTKPNMGPHVGDRSEMVDSNPLDPQRIRPTEYGR